MSSVDKHGRLENDAPFDYSFTKDGKLFIKYEGKIVKTLKGKPAEKLNKELADSDQMGAQLILAKQTGNFKKGNEREMRQKRKK
jgi:hypothetical protein